MKFFMDHKAPSDWAVRRRITMCSLILEGVLVTAITVDAIVYSATNPLLEVIVTNLVTLAGSTIGAYIGFGVWDSKNKLSAQVTQSAVDQADTTTVKADVQ